MRIYVDHVARDVAANILCAIGVIERVVSVVGIEPRRRHRGDHDRTAISAQAVFQQTRQIGVAKIDVFVALNVNFV